MANPQTENGYFRIATELGNAFCKLKISGNDWLILWVVITKTYGWNKTEDKISLSQFQRSTGLSRPTIVRGIKRLVRYGVLGSSKGDTTSSNNATIPTKTYWIVKDYEKWKPSSRNDTSCNFATRPSKKSVVRVVAPMQHTKDNIQKTIKDNSSIRKNRAKLTDEEFLKQIQKTYTWLDIDKEFKKMDAWLLANPRRQKTRKFIINWLNRIEKPMEIKKTVSNKNYWQEPDYMKE